MPYQDTITIQTTGHRDIHEIFTWSATSSPATARSWWRSKGI